MQEPRTCGSCGHLILADDANYESDEDYPYCDDCYGRRHSGHAINSLL